MSSAKKSKYTDPIVISTIVIAIATVSNVVMSVLLWRTTRETVAVAERSAEAAQRSAETTEKSFKSTNRPFVAATQFTLDKDERSKNWYYQSSIRNFGNVAANAVVVDDWHWYINGQEQPRQADLANAPTFLFPGQEFNYNKVLSSSLLYEDVMTGKATLTVKFTLRYQGGPEENYTSTHLLKYYPGSDSFGFVTQ